MSEEFENGITSEEEVENTEAAEQVTEPEAQAEVTAEEPAEAPAQEPEYTDIYSGVSEDEPEEPAEPAAEEPQPEVPHIQAEPVTPPQANANPYSYGQPQYQGYNYQQNYGYNYQSQPQPQQGYYQPAPQPAPEKKDGKKIFLAIIAVIVVFAMGVGTATLFNKGNRSPVVSGNEGVTSAERTTGDDTQLEISKTPTPSKSSGKVLTGTEIAAKVRESNVGIVVYSGNNTTKSAGEGSGIVMGLDSTGKYTYIITCAHVIDDSGVKLKVQTEDGTSYDAEIVGYDTRTDIGVIKVKATGFSAAEFGDSDALQIGDPVYAVGNPGGVEFFGSFTGGHVSAINRPVSSEIGYTMKCIQHDASINPGNSGGMLVNQYGQVVGINSQKIASSSYEGMGFAIPITAAKEIIDDLIQYGYVPNRPMLGITYYPVSASTQYYFIAQVKGLPAGTLIINTISSDSSLNNTNVQKYDMIIAVNGKPLDKADTLIELIDGGKVGDKMTLTLCRVNSNYSVDEFDVTVTLIEDKGGSAVEETTTQAYVNPFDNYGFNFGN